MRVPCMKSTRNSHSPAICRRRRRIACGGGWSATRAMQRRSRRRLAPPRRAATGTDRSRSNSRSPICRRASPAARRRAPRRAARFRRAGSVCGPRPTLSRGTLSTPLGSSTSPRDAVELPDPLGDRREIVMPFAAFGGLVALPEPVFERRTTPMMSSFDTFIGRPNAWCGEPLRQAAWHSRLSPSSSPLVCGPRRNLPPL